MELIVCKFGGTSLATPERVAACRRIVLADPRRRIVVASAPGRRFPGDDKITDLLLNGRLEEARCRLQALADGVGAPLRVELPQTAPRAFLASRGEYYSARILAHSLGCRFADAAECVRFSADGGIDPEATRRVAQGCLDPSRLTVVPGFYGSTPEGAIRTLPRGGSDTTGALLAEALGAALYENFTDVPGLFDADPALAPDAAPVRYASYEEVKLLSRCGANVLHGDAIDPARRAGVAIRLCSSFDPEREGTRIGCRPSERPLISCTLAEGGSLCALCGASAADIARIRSAFPLCGVRRAPGGWRLHLPMPPDEALISMRGLLSTKDAAPLRS